MKTPLAFILTLALVLVACGGDSDADETPAPSATAEPAAEIPVLEITKTEDGFEAPDSIPGGLTRIRVHNAGAREYAVALNRFTDEGTLERLNNAITLGATDFPAAAAEVGRVIKGGGGTGNIAPGGTAEVVFDLTPGRHVISRLMFGTPDTRAIEVTAAPDVRPAPPDAAFTVKMREFAFEGFPDTLPAGKTTLEVVNTGAQFHLMDVRRVNENGIAPEQVGQHLSGTPVPVEPTFTGVGGMGELAPGESGWATLDLEPGIYTLICYVFDQQDGEIGKIHFQLGMHHPFTVQ